MKKLILASLIAMLSVPMLSVAGVAKAGAAVKQGTEPAPPEDERGSNEERDSREETYEGNDRGGGGGSFDGGGYSGGEQFSAVGSFTNQTTEDRGDVLVIRTQVTTPVGGTEICIVYTEKVIDKATNKVIKSDRSEQCY